MDEVTDASTRTPATPVGAFDLHAAADQLLDEARAPRGAGRAARTLTPGDGAPLKQTLLALQAGRQLAEHRAPGAATLMVLRGRATLTWEDQAVALAQGHWTVIPTTTHAVRAEDDAVMLLTVARDVAV